MSRQGKKQRRYKYDTKKESNAIDAFLSDRGMERKPVAKDGSCLFRAVAEQVGRDTHTVFSCNLSFSSRHG